LLFHLVCPEKSSDVNTTLGVIKMKTIIRAFVAVLVLTGAAASTQITSAQTKVTVAKTSAMPIPMCAPDDPNACGMAQGR
jgi:hypothetical protein